MAIDLKQPLCTQQEAKDIGGKGLILFGQENKIITKGQLSTFGCKLSLLNDTHPSNWCPPKNSIIKDSSIDPPDPTTSLGTATVTGSARRTSTGTEFNVTLSGYTRKSGVTVSIKVGYAPTENGAMSISYTFTGLSLANATVSQVKTNNFLPIDSSYPYIVNASVTSITNGYSLRLTW